MPFASYFYFLSMVISIIQVEDFSFGLVASERDPPVSGDREAPDPFAITRKLMRAPTRDIAEFLDIFHFLQEGQNIAALFHGRRGQSRSIVMLNEAPQIPVGNVSDLHKSSLPQEVSGVQRHLTLTLCLFF